MYCVSSVKSTSTANSRRTGCNVIGYHGVERRREGKLSRVNSGRWRHEVQETHADCWMPFVQIYLPHEHRLAYKKFKIERNKNIVSTPF